MKPRLLLICQVPPPTTGAATIGKYIAESRRINERYELTIIPIRMASRVADLGKPSVDKFVKSVALFGKIVGALVSKDYAAVYFAPATSGFAFFRDVMSVLIARAFGTKRILHIHMRGIAAKYKASRLYRVCYRLMFAGAHVIHLSPSLFDDLVDLVPEARRHVVENGIPALSLQKATEPGDATTSHEPTVLFLSNLMLEKGPLDLLAASLRLLRSGIELEVIFVGAFHDPDVKKQIEAGVAEFPDRIFMKGPLYGAEKETILAAADIFAFPSYYRHECQSLAVIEAMASGLAILASRVGGTPDLVRDGVTGLLHAERDIDQVEHGLKRLVEDGALRRSLAAAAREAFLEKFTLESFESRFADTIDRIVARSA